MTQLANIIASILFVSGKEVEEDFIKEKLNVTNAEFRQAVSELLAEYSGESGIQLLHFNKKLQLGSNPEYAKQVEAVLNPIKEKELTNAMLETLAIVAYKQPVTRVEVEEIRGVDCTYSIQNLLHLGLIQAVGRKETIGKPILFGTTDEFLKRFSIESVRDLPDYETFLERLQNATNAMYNDTTTEVPMFNEVEEVPDFLVGEEIVKVE